MKLEAIMQKWASAPSLIGVISRFFLGDVALTFLPLAVIALLKHAFGDLSTNFFLLADWSFATIVLAGLAMVRILELKVGFQRDSSERPILLARVCVLVLISAVLSLSLSQMADAGLEINAELRLVLQFGTLTVSLFLLFLAHTVRELQGEWRRNYPASLHRNHFQHYAYQELAFLGRRLIVIRNALDQRPELKTANQASDIKSSVFEEAWCRDMNTEIQYIAETVSRIPTIGSPVEERDEAV